MLPASPVAEVDAGPPAGSRRPRAGSSAARWLAAFLRTVGLLDLLAAAAIVMPRAMMADIHTRLGLGMLPAEPIVGYLARSASMFYALTGALLLFVARDVARHHSLITWMARCGLVAGLLLIGIDLAEGMPGWWTLSEGPGCLVLSAITIGLQSRQRVRETEGNELD